MIETVAPRMPSAPRSALPENACDSHAHVFGPYEQFPLAEASSYAPPLAPAGLHLQMLDTVGAGRGIVVQPAPYGTDRRAMLDAIAQSAGRLRGVSIATADTSEKTLASLVEGGIRALRFVEMRTPGGEKFKGSVGFDELKSLAPKMKAVGLHAEIWASCAQHEAALADLTALGVPIVLDHMGGIDPAKGLTDPAFRTILRYVAEGAIWVKLVVCRAGRQAPDYSDAQPFHNAFVAANSERLVWGSDWPYVRMGGNSPDVGHMIDLLREWVPDARIRQQILVENPASLYGSDFKANLDFRQVKS